jgi:predicted nucleic acid-binding protein
MSGYLLDTGPFAAFLLGRAWATRLIRPWTARAEAFTSNLVYGEVVEYIRGFRDFAQRHLALQTALQEIAPLSLTYAIMERYADLRRQMRPPYGPGLIGDIDTLIAATALEHRLSVVTMDEDFLRVPGLDVQIVTAG